jgi:hypothetical protein
VQGARSAVGGERCSRIWKGQTDFEGEYGGEDFLEAFLNGLAMARVIFDQKVPEGWVSSGELDSCSDFPYKIGRSFWTDPVPEIPGMPDFSAG